MKLYGGYTNYGQTIGILMLDTVFPRIPGDIGNAYTFDFPVKYRVIRDVFPDRKLPINANEVLLDAFIEAAKNLEMEGCKAITSSCGFLAGFQKELSDAVNIPVFTSVLSLVPMINTMIGSDKSIGILAERGDNVSESLFLKLGWSGKNIPINVSSLTPDSPFSKMIIHDHAEGTIEDLENSITKLVKDHMEKYPNTGAFVLEFQNFAPFGKLIQDISNVPVFSINQLITFIESCINYPSYYK